MFDSLALLALVCLVGAIGFIVAAIKAFSPEASDGEPRPHASILLVAGFVLGFAALALGGLPAFLVLAKGA